MNERRDDSKRIFERTSYLNGISSCWWHRSPDMDYLLRLLLFESLYPALSAKTASPQLRHYGHRMLPAPHVSPDVELLQPECGHGAGCEEVPYLTTGEETSHVLSRFSEHCWVEPLDSLSMAQVGTDRQ